MNIKMRGKEFLSLGELRLSWSLILGKRPENTTVLQPEAMETFVLKKMKNATEAIWKGHPECGKDFQVRIRLTPADTGGLRYSFEYCGNGSEQDVEEILFPVLSAPVKKETALLLPSSLGRMLKPDWTTIQPDVEFGANTPYSFQFSAILNKNGSSFYVDHRDSKFFSKYCYYKLSGDRKRIVYHLKHLLPLTPDNRFAYQLPYNGLIREFQGSWFEAAQIYKEWAQSQKWYKNARRKKPGKLRDIGMWMWNRGNSDHVIPPVKRFQQDSGIPAALDWYWWHNNPYDTDYPEFWPPREGEAIFRKEIRSLNKSGIYSQVYTNGMTWDLDGKTWKEGGGESAIVERSGNIRSYAFNRFNNHRLAYMCGEGREYQSKMSKLVCELRKSGLPGVYLDMIACNAYGVCYNPRHGHAAGGGHHTVDGYRAFLQRLKKENPHLQLSSEDVCEAYLDLFDSFIVLSPSEERLGWVDSHTETVPVYSAIYHGAAALFGNYDMPDGIPPWDPLWPSQERWKDEKEWEKLFPVQFYLELARGVVWGMQPSVHNFQMKHATEERFKELYDYMIRTARFYHAHREFLYDGEMMNPGTLDCGKNDVEFMVRFVFTKEGEYRVSKKADIPVILHSVWRANDGRKALILANYTALPQSYRFWDGNFDVSGTLPAQSWQLVEME